MGAALGPVERLREDMRITDRQLRRIIRESLAQPDVYHVSTDPDIKVFKPRPFWFSDDGTTSGPATPETRGGTIRNLVYASPLSWTPFYTLPRETPRIVVSPDEAALIGDLSGMGIKLDPEAMNLLVRRDQIRLLREHTFTVYRLPPALFTPLDPDGIEWIAQEPVRPLEAATHTDAIKYIRELGWALVPVADPVSLAQRLRALGHFVAGEGL